MLSELNPCGKGHKAQRAKPWSWQRAVNKTTISDGGTRLEKEKFNNLGISARENGPL